MILFSPDNFTIYSYSVNGAEICKSQERAKFIASPLIVKDSYRKDYLIYGTETGDVVLRNAGTLDTIRRISLSGAAPVLSVMITSDLRFLLVGCADGELTVITDPTV